MRPVIQTASMVVAHAANINAATNVPADRIESAIGLTRRSSATAGESECELQRVC